MMDELNAKDKLFSVQDMQKFYDKSIAKIKISDATRNKYLTLYELIRNYSWDSFQRYVEDHNIRKNSYYTYKAAYQYGMLISLKEMLDGYVQAVKDKDEIAVHEFIEAGQYCIEYYLELNPDYQKKNVTQPQIKSRYPKEINSKKAQKLNSKRNSLKKLPQNWQSEIYKQVADKYKIPVLVLALTGCRPEEIRQGIDISLTDDDLIKIHIKGAKVSEDKGHAYRIHYYNPGMNMFASTVKDLLIQNNGHMIVDLPNDNPDKPHQTINTFAKAVKYAGHKLGKKFKPVSLYSFRHQKAADIKKEGFSDIEIAAFLGHKTTGTQSCYGFKQQGRGTTGLVRVEVPNEIRIRTNQFNPDRLANAK